MNYNENLNMEPKIKISKQLADFMHPRQTKEKQKHQNEQQKGSNRAKNQKDQNEGEEDKDKIVQHKPKKSSRNPFVPVHQYIKFSKEIDAKINSVRQGIQMERISKLSFLKNNQLSRNQAQKEAKSEEIRYEDCLTLQVLKKNQNYCLKKILHVPSLTLFYLRESAIDFHTDKHEIEQWIKRCNNSAQKKQSVSAKILQLYWNVPESYYSILYQYFEGIIFQVALDNMGSFPLNFLKKITRVCLQQDYQLFNSQLFIKKQEKQISIFYLPVYEEVDDVIHHERNFRQLLKIDSTSSSLQERLVARVGLLVLLGYFGEVLVDEDISCIFFQNQVHCCLMHRLLDNPSSLVNLFVSCNLTNKEQIYVKQALVDFLCKCLKFKQRSRSGINELKTHKFMKISDFETCSIEQVIYSLQFSGNSQKGFKNSISKDLAIHKMNRVLESIAGILQGAKRTENQIDFTSNNNSIKSLVREFGLAINQRQMQIACFQLSKKLKKIYDN